LKILRIIAAYIIFAGLWFVFMDQLLLSWVQDPLLLTNLQTAKGWLFVLASALMLYPLLLVSSQQQRKAEQAAIQSEKTYRGLFEHHPQAMWLYDPKTLRILAVNSAALARYGYTQAEFLALTITDLHPPERQPELLAHLSRLEPERTAPSQWQHRTKDGRLIDVEVTAHTTLFAGRSARLIMASDISEQRRTGEALAQRTQELSAIFEALPDLYFLLDAQGTVLEYRAGRHSLFLPPEQFLGRRLVTVVPAEVAAQTEAAFGQALSERRLVVFEYTLPSPTGEAFFEARVQPIAPDRLAIIVRDITERQRRERSLRRWEAFQRSLTELTTEMLQRGLDDDFYQHLLQRAIAVLPGAQAGSILLRNANGRYGYVAAQGFDLAELQQVTFSEAELLIASSSHRPERISRHDPLQLDPARAAVLARHGRLTELRASLIVPVWVDDVLAALLNLNAFDPQTDFDAEVVQMAEAFALQVGVLLKRLRLERAYYRLAEFRRQLMQLIDVSLERGLDTSFYQRWLERAVELIPAAEAGSLLLRHPDGLFRFVAAVGYELKQLREVYFYDYEIDINFDTFEPTLISEFKANRTLDPQRRAILDSVGRTTEIKRAFSIPIHVNEAPVAFLYLDSFTDRYAFDQEAMAMAQDFARQLAVTLQRLDLERELLMQQKELEQLANYDALTQLPNRALFLDRLRQALWRAQRSGQAVALLFLDLDGFKLVNDTLGHNTGDELLKAIAERLALLVRAGDTVARLGGDEFTIILNDLSRPQDAGLVAQKALESLAQPFLLEGHELFVSASIGIAVYPNDGGDAEVLIQHADTAMYRAKELGSTYQFFTADMNLRLRERLSLESALRQALAQRQLTVHYQPRVDLRDGRILALEALARWPHSDGWIAPAQFLPLAEEAGLIYALGDEVLRQSCEQLATWRAAGVPVVPVAINLSDRQLRQRDVAHKMQEALSRYRLEGQWLELEIPEMTAVLDPDCLAKLQVLRDLGVRVAIDDFGTAASSLQQLKRLPIDSLKIGPALLAELGEDPMAAPHNAAIVRAIVALARTLALEVVVEGIETEAQRRFVASLGCTQAQGYLFARPSPAAEAQHWLMQGLVPHSVLE
jgi:diguanylate cyclase (GGDEF)-like protein/PAS domain S-box-containing protein